MDIIDVQNYYRNRATLFIYWGVWLLVPIAAGVYLWWGDWASALGTALIFGLMAVPSVLKDRYRLYLPFALELGIVVFIFLTLFLGGIARFYDWVPFWDKFTHVQSGFLLGALGYVLVYVLNEHRRTHLNLSPGFVSFFAITFSLAIGALWETFEFMVDAAFATTYWQEGSLVDTMWDLIADGIGAIIIAIVGYFWMYRHKRLPFTPWLLRVLEKRIERARQIVEGREMGDAEREGL